MRTPVRTFDTFAVRVLPPGARYGFNNSLVNDDPRSLVEFYDTTYADDRDGFGPLGQFVSRYFVGTILAIADDTALDLHGGTGTWRVHASTIARIKHWLRRVTT